MSATLLSVVTTNTVFQQLGFMGSLREGGGFQDPRSITRTFGLRAGGRIEVNKSKWISCSLNSKFLYSCLGGSETTSNSPVVSSLFANPVGEVAISSEQKVYDVVLKQAALVNKQLPSKPADMKPDFGFLGTVSLLNEAHDRFGEVCAEYAKTFYFGSAC